MDAIVCRLYESNNYYGDEKSLWRGNTSGIWSFLPFGRLAAVEKGAKSNVPETYILSFHFICMNANLTMSRPETQLI